MTTTVVRTRAGAAERWLYALAWVLLAGGGALLVAGLDRYVPPCAFRELTGFFCPGCGSGRALVALSRLDLAAALRANVLAVLALPGVAFFLALQTAEAWGVPVRAMPRWRWLPLVALVTVLAFWVLRNLPAGPFALPAPR